MQSPHGSLEKESSVEGMWNAMTSSLSKQRVRLNMKLLGQSGQTTPAMKEDKPTYREQFVPPEMSMISYFLLKVKAYSVANV